jgi:integrase
MKIPAYFRWRNGRPRWEPGPGLREAGHHGRDLKDEKGAWLARGAAMDAAAAINAAIKARGEAAVSGLPARSGRTLADLFDLRLRQGKFRIDPEYKGKRLAPKTRSGYASHFRLLEQWGGDVPVAALTRADIREFYDELASGRGLAQAHAVLRSLKLALNYAVKDLEWISVNRASGLDMKTPEGRLVLWTREEVDTAIAAADWCGLEGVGDAILFAVTMGQRRSNILALPELEPRDDVFQLKTHKTNRECFIPNTDFLRTRIEAMRERKRRLWPNVCFSHAVIDAHGIPYSMDGTKFWKEYRLVRAIASGQKFAIEDLTRALGGHPPMLRNLPFTPLHAIAGKCFADLRDTAITWLLDALKGDIARVANITGHSLATIKQIADKHYFVRNADLARSSAAMLDQFHARGRKGS